MTKHWRLGVLVFAVWLTMVASCTGDSTGPRERAIAAPIHLEIRFPELAQNAAFEALVPFSRVHIGILRGDRTLALDTTVSIASSLRPLSLDLNVRVAEAASTAGEQMTLELSCLNAAGMIMFRAGPSVIVVGVGGSAHSADAIYAGAGAAAKSVRISPRRLNVNAGGDFTFSITAADGGNTTILNAPIEWTSLDSSRAIVVVDAIGVGKARNRRGAGGIVARLIAGQADTAYVDVQPVASALVLLSGSGQTGIVGKTTVPRLAQPLVVRVIATDGLGLGGDTVRFAAQGGGSVTPAIVVTDTNGVAQASWTLADFVGNQIVTATASSLAGIPVTFTATGQASVATRLLFTTAPSLGATLDASQPFTLSVAAVDADGDVVRGFTGTVSLAVTEGPAGATVGGPASMIATGGVATFDQITLTAPGRGYVITAASSGLTPASTPAFNSSAPIAGSLYWLTGLPSPFPTETHLRNLVVMTYDLKGPRAGIPVTFAVTAGDGSVSAAPVMSDAMAQATVDWILGATPGVNTLTAYSPGRQPVSISTNGTIPQLSMVFGVPTLGARQRTNPPDAAIALSLLRSWGLDVQLTHTLPSSVLLPPSPVRIVTIWSQPISVEGLAPGVDTITVSAPTYLPGSGVLRVTLPVLSSTILPTTATTLHSSTPVTVTARDAAGISHPASDTVIVHAVSSDTTVIRPSQPYFYILKNTSTAQTAVTYVGPGTAHITYSDSGGHPIDYVAAKTNDVVVTLPGLQFTGGGWTLGLRQHSYGGANISVPARLNQPLTVSLTSADDRVVTVPATVTIPAGASSVRIQVTAHDTIGAAQITATAPGYAATSQMVQVTQPHFLIWAPSSMWTTSPKAPIAVSAHSANGDYLLVNEDVVVTLTSLTPNVVGLDAATVTIRADSLYSNVANAVAVGPGKARISASDTRMASYAYLPDVASFDVSAPVAGLYYVRPSLGIGQYYVANLGLAAPATAPMTLPIAHTQTGVTGTPASVTVPQGWNYALFNVVGTAAGTDTLSISPPGYVPASQAVTVGPGRFGTFGAWPTSLRVGDSVRVTVRTLDPTGTYVGMLAAPTVVTLTPNANIQIVSGTPNSIPLTSLTIPADATLFAFYVKGRATGTGSLSLTAPTFTPLTSSTTVTP